MSVGKDYTLLQILSKRWPAGFANVCNVGGLSLADNYFTCSGSLGYNVGGMKSLGIAGYFPVQIHRT